MSADVDGRQALKPYVIKKGEPYMSEGQREHFRKLLMGQRDELVDAVHRTANLIRAEVDHYPDDADRATREEELGIELRTRDRERRLLAKIDKSLAQLSQGEYGYCESCGNEIGLRRLEARPTATLCIDCKNLAEMRERH